jgi:hypothetical protein
MIEDRKAERVSMMVAADTRPRPVLAYREMSPEEFVVAWFFGRFVEMFAIALVYLGTNKTWPGASDWRKVSETSGDITPELLFKLADQYYERGLFWVLCERMCEQTYVMEELNKRLENHEIGVNLVLIPQTLKLDGDLSRVHRRLKIDNVKPYPGKEKHYDTNDIKAVGVDKAFRAIKDHTLGNRLPLPPFPLRLAPFAQNIWDTWMTEAWEQGIANAFGEIIAALSVDDEELRQKSRDQVRELFRDSKQYDEVFVNQEGFHVDDHAPITSPEERVEVIQRVEKAYQDAEDRWGEKGRAFVDNLIATESVTETARAIEISRKTGHEWRNQLKKSSE